MPQQHNPFRPKQPIYEGSFAGRDAQLKHINRVLIETREGNPTYLLFVGERGIGKTSLILAAKALAESGGALQQRADDDDAHDFLTVTVGVSQDTTLADFCHKISKELERALASSETAMQLLKTAWSFLQRLEVAGTKFNAGKESSNLRDDLIYSLVDTVKAITNASSSMFGLRRHKDGLVLFIDEADNAPADLNLGGLVKELNERLASEACNKLVIVAAGLPSVKDVLVSSHPSSSRLFDVVELEPLTKTEAQDVITNGVAMANVKFRGRHTVVITQEAVDYICLLSGGHPHFLQQFGYSVYAADTDFFINKEDVYAGVRQATEALGKFYSDMYDRIRHVPLCEDVLQHMSSRKDEWLSYDQLLTHFCDNRVDLEKAVSTLLNERVLVSQGGASRYRIQWAGLAIWLKLLPLHK